MSAHGHKARARHPEAHGARRKTFSVGHVEFELIDHATDGATFGLRTLEGPPARPCLFSAHIPPGMAAELRQLADAGRGA